MSPRVRTILVRSLLALALIYAFLAGLHTVARADLGWQLATGRWMAQNHSIPSTDVLSHTAGGHEWIYPPVSSLFLYAVERIGGFAALSWLGAIFCVGTIAILLRRASAVAAVLAIIAVPMIAERTAPRAEMFTLVFFAAFAVILWRQHRERGAPLWLLPILMLLWVNLHPGFIAGLALLAAYVVLELGDVLVAENRFATARAQIATVLPLFLATFAMTLANRWGWRIYHAIAEQESAARQHALWFAEWIPLRLTGPSLRQALFVRDPRSAIFWLLLAAAVAALLYIGQRRFGSAAVLVVAGWLTIQHVRYEPLFACLVVVIAAPAFLPPPRSEASSEDAATSAYPVLLIVALVLALIFVGVRSYDLVSNRFYMTTLEGPVFGAGLSSTYPRAAADFVREHRLPREILNDYSTGGYWLWALGPDYPDYVDGRALPFGPELLQRADELLGRIPPDAPAWDEETRTRGVQTVVVGLGTSNFATLPLFCRNQNWTPVYLDAWGAVFVRPQPDHSLDNLRIDCAATPIVTDADANPRSPAERFYALVSGTRILHLLGRDEEALTRIAEAQAIFAGNADAEMQRGIVLFALHRTDQAEQALRASVDMRPGAQNCGMLGQFYAVQKRFHSAISAFACAAKLSPYPGRMYLTLAQLQLQINDPKAALAELDRAWRHAAESDAEQTHRFQADIAEFRARTYWQTQDSTAAANAMRQATQLDAGNPTRWQHLAELYDALNRKDEAAQARQRAQQLNH
jgi:tetratricopeptide (TPR) repeat protein